MTKAVKLPNLRWTKWGPAKIKWAVNYHVGLVVDVCGEIQTLPEGQRTFQNTFVALDDLDTTGRILENRLVALRDGSGSKKIREVASEWSTKLKQALVTIKYSPELYKILIEASKEEGLDAIDTQLAQDYLAEFARNGMELDAKSLAAFQKNQKRIVALEKEAEQGMNEFDGSIEISEADTTGLSDRLKSELANESGGYTVTLAHYRPFMEQAKSARARQKLAKVFLARAPKRNLAIIEELLELREHNSVLLNRRSYAHLRLEPMVTKSPEHISALLTRLEDQLTPAFRAEMEAMAKVKSKRLRKRSSKVEFYDIIHYGTQLKKERAGIDLSVTSEYFELEGVLKRIFEFYDKIFGLRTVPIDGIQAWHPDVRGYVVYDKQTNEIEGFLLLDLFFRDGKYKGTAQETMLESGHMKDGKRVVPYSALMTNFSPSAKGAPTLVPPDQTINLGHEIGHAYQDVLTRARRGRHAGTNVPQDVIEVPSVLIEHLFWQKKTLQALGRHFKTGEPMPEKLIDGLLSSRRHDLLIWTAWNIAYSKADLEAHMVTPSPTHQEMASILTDAIERMTGVSFPKDHTFPGWWFYMFGEYDVLYSVYLRNLGISYDLFSEFVKHGVDDPTTGMRWREVVLEKGGEGQFMDHLFEFLGRDAREDALIELIG